MACLDTNEGGVVDGRATKEVRSCYGLCFIWTNFLQLGGEMWDRGVGRIVVEVWVEVWWKVWVWVER